MIITKHLVSVFVSPEYNGQQNVIRRVMWFVRFEDAGIRSEAFAETFLNADSITDFIPAEQVGTERVLQWAFDAQGGDDFIAHIQPYHEDNIAQQKLTLGQELFTEGFDTSNMSAVNGVPSAVL